MLGRHPDRQPGDKQGAAAGSAESVESPLEIGSFRGREVTGSGPTASELAYDTEEQVPQELLEIMTRTGPSGPAQLLAESPHSRIQSSSSAATHRNHGGSALGEALSSSLYKPQAPAQPDSKQPSSPRLPGTPVQPTQALDAEHAKHVSRGMTAGWDQLAIAPVDERSTPSNIRLPSNIVKQLERAWRESISGEQKEQGGNLVRNYGGSYEIRRGPSSSDRMFEQQDNDVGWTQKLVAQVHTHPYRDEKDRVPEQYATFSEGDFDSLMRSKAHMSVLRSGPYTFVLSKTKQFEAIVDATGNDEDRLRSLAQQMRSIYDKTYTATEGSFSEKTEAGVMAVCREFHLVYYAGQGSDLMRKTERPQP